MTPFGIWNEKSICFIKNRVFGAPVSEDVKDFFKNLQKGIFHVDTTAPIFGEYKDYLGDSIPFVRMWCAVQVSGSESKITKYFVTSV